VQQTSCPVPNVISRRQQLLTIARPTCDPVAVGAFLTIPPSVVSLTISATCEVGGGPLAPQDHIESGPNCSEDHHSRSIPNRHLRSGWRAACATAPALSHGRTLINRLFPSDYHEQPPAERAAGSLRHSTGARLKPSR
jgi:hypothetical protein